MNKAAIVYCCQEPGLHIFSAKHMFILLFFSCIYIFTNLPPVPESGPQSKVSTAAHVDLCGVDVVHRLLLE